MASTFLDPTADGASNAWTKSTGTAGWSLLDDAVRQPTAPTTGSDDVTSTTVAGTLQDIVFPTGTYDSTAVYTLWVYGKHGNRTGWSTLISTDDSTYANEVTMVAAATPAGGFAWFSRDISSLIVSQATLDGLRVQLKTLTIAGGSPTASEVDAVYVEIAPGITAPTLANSFEGGTDTTTITAANSGGASGDAFDVVNIFGTSTLTFSSTHPSGVLGAQVVNDTVNATQGATVQWTTTYAAGGNVTTTYGRMYLYLTALPASGYHMLGNIGLSGVGSCAYFYILGGSGVIRCLDSLDTSTTGSVAVAVNQLVRVEFKAICLAGTSGVMEAKLFNTAASTTADETITKTGNCRAAGNQMIFGPDGNQGLGFTSWFDDIQINGAGYPGPVVPTSVTQPFRAIPFMSRR